MKQKLFMMLAALMLMGTSAMAQSETLKGDVNGDGAVDVADIAAEVKKVQDTGIVGEQYYWYVGQTAITADNYATLAKKITTKLTPREYKTEKFGKVYVLIPDVVKSIKIKDVNAGTYWSESRYSIDSTISISGYNVYVTSTSGANAPIIVEFYY
jgi:hypothetical protein